MSEQLQLDFDKLVKTSKFSNEEIQFKKNFLNKKSGVATHSTSKLVKKIATRIEKAVFFTLVFLKGSFFLP